MANRAVHAVFETVEGARRALAGLAAAGVDASDIEVRSSIPHHGLEPEGVSVGSRVPIMAIVGGLLGGTAAFLLVSFSSMAYELPTGGMAIVALPAAGVVTFEGTAIGAILFTVATVLFECGLPGFGRVHGPLDQHVAAGRILIVAEVDEAAASEWASGALVTEVVHGGS